MIHSMISLICSLSAYHESALYSSLRRHNENSPGAPPSPQLWEFIVCGCNSHEKKYWIGRKLLWGRKWKPTPVFLPGESQGRGSLVGCHLWGRTESDTTEVASQHRKTRANFLTIPIITHDTSAVIVYIQWQHKRRNDWSETDHFTHSPWAHLVLLQENKWLPKCLQN